MISPFELVDKAYSIFKNVTCFTEYLVLKLARLNKAYIPYISFRGHKKLLRFFVPKNVSEEDIFKEVLIQKVYFAHIKYKKEFAIKRIKTFKTIIDVGANLGFFSIYVANLNPNSKVYSIEPSSKNYDFLIKNIKSNNLKNIISIKAAVYDTKQRQRLYIDYKNCGKNTLVPSKITSKNGEYEVVKTTTLPDIFKKYELKYIDLIKLDCEGAELKILSCLSKDDFKQIRRLVVEYHSEQIKEELVKLLTKNNFEVYTQAFRRGLGLLFAIHNN